MEDTFFFDQGRLDSLLDFLNYQSTQVGRLRRLMQTLRYSIPPDQIALYNRIQEKLDKSEYSLRTLVQALCEHSEDLQAYFSRLSSNLDELVIQIERVFI